MRYFADENVPALVVQGLRADGHDVLYGCEQDHGATDTERIDVAIRERRVIITEDNDFAELIMLGQRTVAGLIRFDLPAMSRQTRAQRILDALAEIGEFDDGRMFVIEAARIRVRA